MQGLGLIEHRANKANRSRASSESNQETKQSWANAVEKDGAEKLLATGAERNADSEFGCALGDEICEDTVKASGGEYQGDDREGEDEQGVELRIDRGLLDSFA